MLPHHSAPLGGERRALVRSLRVVSAANRLLDDVRQRRQLARVDGLAQPKVAELHVPVRAQQQVVGLDVAVDEVVAVDRLQRHNRLCDVEPRLLLGQRVAPHQQRHHVAAGQILHHQIQKLLVLAEAGGKQGDDVRRRHRTVLTARARTWKE